MSGKKVFIFDLDKTLTTENGEELEDEQKPIVEENINKILDYIDENNYKLYIVTARRFLLDANKVSSKNIALIEWYILRQHVQEGIFLKIIRIVAENNKSFLSKDDVDFIKSSSRRRNFTEMMKILSPLNRDPKTRWLYYNFTNYKTDKDGNHIFKDNKFELIHSEDSLKLLNLPDEVCILRDFIINFFTDDIDKEFVIKNVGNGLTKMFQIFDIKDKEDVPWKDIYFFDDAPHNFNAWKLLSDDENEPGMGEMNYKHNNGYEFIMENPESINTEHVFLEDWKTELFGK